MLSRSVLLFLISSALLPFTIAAPSQTEPKGISVFPTQEKSIDWTGLSFAYLPATVGEAFINPKLDEQNSDCCKAGLLCGAYHLAYPNMTSGQDQADYFIQNGGGWKKSDDRRLPGALILGHDGNAAGCFGLSSADMVRWVRDFSDVYHQATSRYPIIGAGPNWWKTCTDDDASFKSTNPLGLLGLGEVPGNWGYWSFLQYSEPNPTQPGKLKWHDDYASLKAFAKGH